MFGGRHRSRKGAYPVPRGPVLPSGRAGKRPCIIQSRAYRQYAKMAKEQIALLGTPEPCYAPIHVKCLYYLATTRTPDLINLMAATHDILEDTGVILDDVIIQSVDGSRIIGKDPQPRVEIEIEAMHD